MKFIVCLKYFDTYNWENKNNIYILTIHRKYVIKFKLEKHSETAPLLEENKSTINHLTCYINNSTITDNTESSHNRPKYKLL